MDVPVPAWRCRWCRSDVGDVVLDLGLQPPAGLLPEASAPRPDPTEPLRMVLCARCRLAQLEVDGTAPTERPGVEPEAMVDQGRWIVGRLAASGLLRVGSTFRQYPSPHGGDWGALLRDVGARHRTADDGDPDLVLDVFGLMHDADLAAAWQERVDAIGSTGVLVVQYHSLAGDLGSGAWHTLRPGHYSCFSTPVLVDLARSSGLVPVGCWQSDLQGGTGVLAFARPGHPGATDPGVQHDVDRLVAAETAAGVLDVDALRTLGSAARSAAGLLRDYVTDRRADGLTVAGYGAASRTPMILTLAGLDATDLVAVADASPGKQGRTLPVGRIPVVAPDELDALRCDRVLLFVPELLDEVRRSCPGVEARGGRWVVLDPVPHETRPAVEAAATTRGSEG